MLKNLVLKNEAPRYRQESGCPWTISRRESMVFSDKHNALTIRLLMQLVTSEASSRKEGLFAPRVGCRHFTGRMPDLHMQIMDTYFICEA
jgi:hypothetical protein